MKKFKLIKTSNRSKARLGQLTTAHGKVVTPFFMPVATQGVLKHVTAEEIRRIGFKTILSNTYHLMLRPGEKHISKMGGLHKFMDWDRAILTDSGGFQVFSLSGQKREGQNNLVKLDANGVKFRSYVDGREFYLTPEKAMQIQADLGVDIAVCLDECVALPTERKYIEKSVETTIEWAKRTKAHHFVGGIQEFPLQCGVIQGGLEKDLRIHCTRALVDMDFDIFNIGGLSVGESPKDMYYVLDWVTPFLPADKPRYLMGVGYPENIVEAVKRGVDMFDCVIPTREGRHGRLFLKKRISNSQFPISKRSYETISITNAKFAKDIKSINPESKFSELRNYSKAYLNYLFKIKEPLGLRLATLNNLEFYFDLMKEIKSAIKEERL